MTGAMMKAIRLHGHGGPEVLTYESVPVPQPAAGEVVIRTRATGVNFADTIRRRGGTYAVPTPLPYLLGGEAVGIVEAVGEGADPGLVGRRVLVFPGQGSYAEFVAAPEIRVYPLPDTLPDAEALALFVQGLTAALILKKHVRMDKSDTVLVQAAAGGVGSIAIQLARHYGAAKVIGCASSEEKRALVLSLGADAAVDYSRAGWGEEVRTLTGGKGVDVVMEVTGGEVAATSFALLKTFGRVCAYGLTSEDRWQIDTQNLCPKCAFVSGFWLRQYLDDKPLILAELDELARLVASGALKIQIGGRFRLSDAVSAHQALETRASMGKLILVPDALFS
ncbi:quinone oxidoreductase family protein [Frigidibacter mobilis]|uniref:Putative zinc-dependent NADPH:quinone oxidoreductase n=1 Tax=Frigidibacter mobilis TaxID=1335048 RepID=A0A159Z6Q3_9RHOB|nr:zinc-binding dehydrogenase [Frigidibacter mobilis]AMY71045.1 putative zinc-dependent NADPH:quinone oxidoreductase [Frigidibacter mobilis]